MATKNENTKSIENVETTTAMIAPCLKNEKFNEAEATLDQFNRELKRLASRKCLAKNDDFKAQYEAEYRRIADIKANRFTKARKCFRTMTLEEVMACSLEDVNRAIKSLRSTICQYPSRRDECQPQLDLFLSRRDKIMAEAAIREAQKILEAATA